METTLTIPQVARQSGLSIDTLRYYERIGLLGPVARASSGHRRYTERDIAWIELLIRLRDSGMPRAQMVRFTELRRHGDATATERRLLLEQRQRTLEQRMAVLQRKVAHIKEIEARRGAISRTDALVNDGVVGSGADRHGHAAK